MATILRRYCPVCKANGPAEKRSSNSALHVILCLCTCGLWIPFWILIDGTKGYACRTCGASTRSPLLRSLTRAIVVGVALIAAILFVMRIVSPM